MPGAIQDHDRGLLVGQRSWGKGLVQSVYTLPYGAGLALTTARYYTPSGRWIQRDYSDLLAYVNPDGLGLLDRGAASRRSCRGRPASPSTPTPAASSMPREGSRRTLSSGTTSTPSCLTQLLARSMFFNFAVDWVSKHPETKEDFTVTPEIRDTPSSGSSRRRSSRAPRSCSASGRRTPIAASSISRFGSRSPTRSSASRRAAGFRLSGDSQVQKALTLFDEAARIAALPKKPIRPAPPSPERGGSIPASEGSGRLLRPQAGRRRCIHGRNPRLGRSRSASASGRSSKASERAAPRAVRSTPSSTSRTAATSPATSAISRTCGRASRSPSSTSPRLIDELAELGVRSVRMSGGGDPLAHREAGQVLDHLHSRGIVLDNLTTNGALLSPEIAQRLIEYRAREVLFSLNAVDRGRLPPDDAGQGRDIRRRRRKHQASGPRPRLGLPSERRRPVSDRPQELSRTFRGCTSSAALSATDRIAVGIVLNIPNQRIAPEQLLHPDDGERLRPYFEEILRRDRDSQLLQIDFPVPSWNAMLTELKERLSYPPAEPALSDRHRVRGAQRALFLQLVHRHGARQRRSLPLLPADVPGLQTSRQRAQRAIRRPLERPSVLADAARSNGKSFWRGTRRSSNPEGSRSSENSASSRASATSRTSSFGATTPSIGSWAKRSRPFGPRRVGGPDCGAPRPRYRAGCGPRRDGRPPRTRSWAHSRNASTRDKAVRAREAFGISRS